MSGKLDPQGQSTEPVADVTNLSDEALADAFKKHYEEVSHTEVQAPPDSEPVNKDNSESQEAQPEGTQIDPLPDGKSESDPAKSDNSESEEPVESAAKLQEANAQLKKQLENLQYIYGKQSNELGVLRARLKPKPTDEDYERNPAQAHEQMEEHKQGVKEIEEKAQNLQALQVMKSNVEFHQTYNPTLNANMSGLREFLVKTDGATEQEAHQFLGNIYMQHPLAVYHLNKRYEESQKIKQLEKQIQELKHRPAATVRKMVDMNEQTPAIRAHTGETSPMGDSIIQDSHKITRLSDEALAKQLEASLRNER